MPCIQSAFFPPYFDIFVVPPACLPEARLLQVHVQCKVLWGLKYRTDWKGNTSHTEVKRSAFYAFFFLIKVFRKVFKKRLLWISEETLDFWSVGVIKEHEDFWSWAGCILPRRWLWIWGPGMECYGLKVVHFMCWRDGSVNKVFAWKAFGFPEPT